MVGPQQTRKARTVVSLACAAALAAVLASVAGAQTPQLDPTFGLGGRVITDLSGGTEVASAVVAQPDGKLLVAGTATAPGAAGRAGTFRYLPTGVLDGTFGTNGVVLSNLDGAVSTQAVAIALLADEKILVAARSFVAGSNFRWGVFRYDANGTLDPSFGTGGQTVVTFGPGFDVLNAIVVTPGGKIVLAGGTNSGSNAAFVLVGLNSDGSIDSTFGSSGRVRTPFPGSFAIIADAKLQKDGRIVVGGMRGGAAGSTWAFARYLQNGTLDETFGSGGTTAFGFGTQAAESSGLSLLADGKILAVGSTLLDNATFESGFAAARMNSDGSLDPSFGVDGKTVGRGGFFTAVVAEADGSAIAAGSTLGPDRDFLIARFDADGALDAIVRTDFGAMGEIASDLIRTSDARYVSAGTRNDFAGHVDIALARYELIADATPPHVAPIVSGTQGDAGWYMSDVEISWSVTDDESPITATQGCESRVVSSDTTGVTLTCVGTSSGGTTSVSVTIRRDATAPTMSCEATPAELWPPSHTLEPVEVAVGVEDKVSGPRGFVLSSIDAGDGDAALDLAGWTVGEPDTVGFVRSERSGGTTARVYSFEYRGSDLAGNRAACEATVTVPHDVRP